MRIATAVTFALLSSACAHEGHREASDSRAERREDERREHERRGMQRAVLPDGEAVEVQSDPATGRLVVVQPPDRAGMVVVPDREAQRSDVLAVRPVEEQPGERGRHGEHEHEREHEHEHEGGSGGQY